MDTQRVIQVFQESAEIKQRFVQEYADQILLVAQAIVKGFREEGKVLLFGNGGSATDSSHIAAEFVGRYQRDRSALPAIALTTDMAMLTSISTDYDYSDIFARQIAAHGQKGDIAIAISTSGNSPNVLKGAQMARTRGLVTVAWTGRDGGQLAKLVDYAFIVPSAVTARIQECHITLGHVLCEIVEERLFAQDP